MHSSQERNERNDNDENSLATSMTSYFIRSLIQYNSLFLLITLSLARSLFARRFKQSVRLQSDIQCNNRLRLSVMTGNGCLFFYYQCTSYRRNLFNLSGKFSRSMPSVGNIRRMASRHMCCMLGTCIGANHRVTPPFLVLQTLDNKVSNSRVGLFFISLVEN